MSNSIYSNDNIYKELQNLLNQLDLKEFISLFKSQQLDTLDNFHLPEFTQLLDIIHQTNDIEFFKFFLQYEQNFQSKEKVLNYFIEKKNYFIFGHITTHFPDFQNPHLLIIDFILNSAEKEQDKSIRFTMTRYDFEFFYLGINSQEKKDYFLILINNYLQNYVKPDIFHGVMMKKPHLPISGDDSSKNIIQTTTCHSEADILKILTIFKASMKARYYSHYQQKNFSYLKDNVSQSIWNQFTLEFSLHNKKDSSPKSIRKI